MAGEWRTVAVGDIAAPERNALVGGPFGSNLVSRDYVDAGVPVIRGENMGERWVSGDFAYVTEVKARSLAGNLARPGDIVFTQRGTLGQVALVPKGPFGCYLVSQSQMKLTVDRTKADPLFFYYVFSSSEQRNHIQRNAIQTGVPHTNLGILRDTPVRLPSLSEQRAIAHILGTLDDKIELNRRLNETLEAMARALFKSWFVDFLPVRAKMAARTQTGDPVRLPAEGSAQAGAKHALSKIEGAEGRPSTSSGHAILGLPKHLADLFPDAFEDSELGEIPAGWRVGKVGDLATLSRDSLNPVEFPDEMFDHFSIPAFDEGRSPKP
jgi:type I restriction enzyme S subunit